MFDSFDQEEQKLVEQLEQSERGKKTHAPGKHPVRTGYISNMNKFAKKVNAKDFITASSAPKQDFVKANKEKTKQIAEERK